MADIEKKRNMFSDFVNRIEEKISDLTVLNIRTIVGDFNYIDDENIEPKRDGEFRMIFTDMSLIDGDITTRISNDIMQDKYAWVRDFHARKEEKGHEIVQGNIRAIMQLFELFRSSKNVKVNEENIDDTSAEPLADEDGFVK